MSNTLNNIPVNVYDEINILDGAPEKFISEVSKLESMSDVQERALEAFNYLNANNGKAEISFKLLGEVLRNPDKISKRGWRNLYLIERSIVSTSSNYSWVTNLKILYNTYLEECQLMYKPYKDSKFYFLNKSGDLENLYAGSRATGSIFYYYDDTLSGATWNKMVKVVMRYAYDRDVDSEILDYTTMDKTTTYNANHVVVFKEGKGYCIADCHQAERLLVEKLSHIAEPTGLFKIK